MSARSFPRPARISARDGVLETTRIYLNGGLSETELSVTVRDTGIGIAPEDLDRVFEQYYRAPAAKRVEPLGTGLGMFTVKRFCDLLGGTARIESAPGEGTTCTVVVPRRSPSIESASSAQQNRH